MHLLTALTLFLPIASVVSAAQEAKEFKISLQAKDGTSLTGTAALPPSLAVKTKFGDVQIDTATIIEINRQGPQFSFRLTTGSVVMGTWSPGKIDIQTPGGKLSVPEDDLRSVGFPGVVPDALKAPTPAPVPAAPKKEPRFRGFDYRKEYVQELLAYKTFERTLLLSGGGQLALLDPKNDECVIVDLASQNCTRIKVEAAPICLAEKAGKLYVANSRSSSLTVIDPRGLKAVGKVTIGASPRSVAAPVLGDTLYVVTSGGDNFIQCVDVRTDRVTSPLINSDYGRPISVHSAQGLAVSPDNRVLMLTGNEGHGPSCRPDVYILSGQKATSYHPNHLHTDHSPAYVMDLVGGRLYAGWLVYSLDLRERIGELPSMISVPHPTRNLIFGSKKGQTRGVPSQTLLVIDEEKLTSIAEVEIGDDIRALVPTETKLYVVGPTSVYPLDLSAIVPAEALAKPRLRRVPVDLAKAVPEADIKKAQALNAEAQRLIDGGKFDEAGSKFDQAYALDPLSGAKAGQGQVLLRKKSLPEAIELLKAALNHPFRNSSTRFEVYAYLGIAYGQSNQNEAAVRTFQEGLRFEPKDPFLLKNLGIAHGNSGNLALAYVAWSRCLLADPKQSDARKLLDEATKRLIAATTAKCDSCGGDGKFETVVQEQGAAKKKIMSDCKTCKAGGKTWKRPCVDCQATGRTFPDNYCQKCYGRGSVPEPAK